MIRPPELSELETLVLAVELGSIAAAAERLRISAPAAAKRIRQLEALAGTELLQRGARGVRPTQRGSAVYPLARDLLARRARIVDALEGRPGEESLRIPGVRQVLRSEHPPRPEDVIRQTEALFATLFHASGEPIILSRPEDGLIYEINDAAVRFTGYQQAEVRGRVVTDVQLWADMSARNALVERAITSQSPQHGELIAVTRSGEQRRVRCSLRTVELHGERYLLFIFDVTAGEQ
jgi:PAS domain S-box-containing protein